MLLGFLAIGDGHRIRIQKDSKPRGETNNPLKMKTRKSVGEIETQATCALFNYGVTYRFHGLDWLLPVMRARFLLRFLCQ